MCSVLNSKTDLTNNVFHFSNLTLFYLTTFPGLSVWKVQKIQSLREKKKPPALKSDRKGYYCMYRSYVIDSIFFYFCHVHIYILLINHFKNLIVFFHKLFVLSPKTSEKLHVT